MHRPCRELPRSARPVYADLTSSLLTNSLHRMLRPAAGRDPEASVRFTEMLPGPGECWLEHAGARYTGELHLGAVGNVVAAIGMGTWWWIDV